MDHQTAHLEVVRLIEHCRSMSFAELARLANTGENESSFFSQGELITLSIDIRRISEDSVRVHVSAYGNNWWKQERVDESTVVMRDDHERADRTATDCNAP